MHDTRSAETAAKSSHRFSCARSLHEGYRITSDDLLVCLDCILAFAPNDMPNRVHMAQDFVKMFRNGFQLCKAVPQLVDRHISVDFSLNIPDSGNATIYLAVDEASILWPLVFV